MTIRGIAFPFSKGLTGFPASKTDEDVVTDNVIRIIQTWRGSRVMRPDAGSDCYAFCFESTGPLLQARIDAEVQRAVSAGEPRAKIIKVIVAQQELEDGTEIVIDVIFEVSGVVRKASTSFNLANRRSS